jgi:hypothetical protein
MCFVLSSSNHEKVQGVEILCTDSGTYVTFATACDTLQKGATALWEAVRSAVPDTVAALMGAGANLDLHDEVRAVDVYIAPRINSGRYCSGDSTEVTHLTEHRVAFPTERLYAAHNGS